MVDFAFVAHTKLYIRTRQQVNEYFKPIFDLSQQYTIKPPSRTGNHTLQSTPIGIKLYSLLYNAQYLSNRFTRLSPRVQQLFINFAQQVMEYCQLNKDHSYRGKSFNQTILNQMICKHRNTIVSGVYFAQAHKHCSSMVQVLSCTTLSIKIAEFLFPQNKIKQYFQSCMNPIQPQHFISYSDDLYFTKRSSNDRQALLNNHTYQYFQRLVQSDCLNILPYLGRLSMIYQAFHRSGFEINRFLSNPFVLYEAWKRKLYKLNQCPRLVHWSNVKYNSQSINEQKHVELFDKHEWDGMIHHDNITIDLKQRTFRVISENMLLNCYIEAGTDYYDCSGSQYMKRKMYFIQKSHTYDQEESYVVSLYQSQQLQPLQLNNDPQELYDDRSDYDDYEDRYDIEQDKFHCDIMSTQIC